MTSPPQPASPRVAVANWLLLIFIVAEFLRVGTAIWQVRRNNEKQIVHEFPDSELYWKLALNVAHRGSYDDGRRQLLRTPGYPVFLAGCIQLFGDSPTGARHLQAAIGSLSCVLLFFLVRRLLGTRAGLVSAAVAAIYPFAVFLSAVLLSESLFTFALLLQLLCLVQLWDTLNRSATLGRVANWGALTGLFGAVATLVRPSWFLVTPLIAAWLFFPRRPNSSMAPQGKLEEVTAQAKENSGRSDGRLWFNAGTSVLTLFILTMCPWWVRNWIVTEHFVPTTLWVGASLYDGFNERATGASNMEFMDRPAEWGLDSSLDSMSEWAQDQYLRGEAWRFARERPWRIIELAAIKFGRFWNPLPNAEEWRSPFVRLVSVASCGPVLVLALIGAWRLRKRWGVIAVLAGPVLYFCAIHLVFVSSIRYREAAMLPVLGLVAAALVPKAELSDGS